MNKACTTILALLFAAGVHSATAQTNVLSQNAVGYVKITIEPGDFVLVNVPFLEVGDSSPRTITEAIGDQLTGTSGFIAPSDYVIKFNTGTQSYQLHWKKNDDGTWRDTTDLFNATTNTLSPGDGFFIQNNQATSQTVYVMGEVPDASTYPSNIVNLITGFNMVSYSYPTDVAITNLNFNFVNPGPTGDQLVRWDASNQSYRVYVYDNIGFGGSVTGWKNITMLTGSPTTDKLSAGEAIFYNRTGSSTNWVETKPYAYP